MIGAEIAIGAVLVSVLVMSGVFYCCPNKWLKQVI